MKLTFALIDDDVYVHRDVRLRLAAIPNLEMVAAFGGAQEALDYFAIHDDGVDMILCDILMPGMDGYEAAHLLYGYYDMLLYLTGKTAHGEEVFGSPALGYLKKPVNAGQVQEKLNQLVHLREQGHGTGIYPDFVMVNDRNTQLLVKVKIDDILRVEINDKMATLYTQSGQQYMIQESLRAILRQLKGSGHFIRISAKEVISFRDVRSVSSDLMVELADGTFCGVKDTFKPSARAFFRRWQIG